MSHTCHNPFSIFQTSADLDPAGCDVHGIKPLIVCTVPNLDNGQHAMELGLKLRLPEQQQVIEDAGELRRRVVKLRSKEVPQLPCGDGGHAKSAQFICQSR